jgi:DNA helicase-2/ATP-dependent DNA helicase PcrA
LTSLAFSATPKQAEIIALRAGAHLVLAPPGSGKTGILTQRIVGLIQESPRDPFRILALTFTKKAAENMRARIEAEIGREWQRVTVTTFHSFCLDVLQHYGEHVGLVPPLTVFENEGDRRATLAQALEDEGLPLPERHEAERVFETILREIGRQKRNLAPPESVPAEAECAGMSLRTAYTSYDRLLRRYGALDFDDLLRLCYDLLVTNPRVAAHYRRIYRFILVDEAQDTSRAQYEILRALCGDDHRNVMLVADADQSIYGFAGASDKYLKAFVRDFGAQKHSLSENFRCGEAIVQVAASLIAHNPDRISSDHTMISVARAPGHVTAASYANEGDEATAVADMLVSLLAKGLDPSWLYPGEDPQVDTEDLCVLARSRYNLDGVVEQLKARGIPVAFRSAQTELFESRSYRFVYNALRVVHNDRDLPARASLIAQIEGVATDTDTPFVNILGRVGESGDEATALFAPPLLRYIHGPASVDALLQALAGIPWSAQNGESDRELREHDARALQDRWSQYSRTSKDPELGGFLAELALAGRTAIDEKGVRALTVHAAKGLEFRAVVMVGMNEGSFPDFRSQTGQALVDERRNAYVAVTRAERRLHLTRPRTRTMPWGDLRAQQPSRFLAEMNLAILEA